VRLRVQVLFLFSTPERHPRHLTWPRERHSNQQQCPIYLWTYIIRQLKQVHHTRLSFLYPRRGVSLAAYCLCKWRAGVGAFARRISPSPRRVWSSGLTSLHYRARETQGFSSVAGVDIIFCDLSDENALAVALLAMVNVPCGISTFVNTPRPPSPSNTHSCNSMRSQQ
jgi:hypothetical protein